MQTIIILSIVSAVIVFIGIPFCRGVYYGFIAQKHQFAIDSTAGLLIASHLEDRIDAETVATEMEKAVNEIVSERWTEAYKKAVVKETVRRIPMAKNLVALNTVLAAIDEHRATKQ